MQVDQTIRVFNIEKYHIHDGQGIRTAVFLKGCHLKCPWCSNPESQREHPQIAVFANLCTGCGLCRAVCTQQAVLIEKSLSCTDESKCSYCGRCVSMCPRSARKIYGRDMTADEILKEVLKDSAFYNRSQGGVTLTGGEPLLHGDFVAQFLALCHSELLTVAIETSGLLPCDMFNRAALAADELLIDVKTTDPEKLPVVFGRLVNGRQKLAELRQNLKSAVQAGCRTVLRCPIIPGFNDSEVHIRRVAQWALDAGAAQVDLLPFHQYGRHKYEALHMEYPLKDARPLHSEDLCGFQRTIEAAGLRCTIGG